MRLSYVQKSSVPSLLGEPPPKKPAKEPSNGARGALSPLWPKRKEKLGWGNHVRRRYGPNLEWAMIAQDSWILKTISACCWKGVRLPQTFWKLSNLRAIQSFPRQTSPEVSPTSPEVNRISGNLHTPDDSQALSLRIARLFTHYIRAVSNGRFANRQSSQLNDERFWHVRECPWVLAIQMWPPFLPISPPNTVPP